MTRTDVTFDSAGIALAGHLYTPDGAAVSGPRPAIVVGHPGSGVKEQAAGLYAEPLAGQGFVTLAFDAAYQGESGGEPRGLEDPAHRVEDLKAAVSYLTRGPRSTRTGSACSASAPPAATCCRPPAGTTGSRRWPRSGVDIARQFRLGADGAQDPAVFQGMLDAAAARAPTRPVAGAPVPALFPDTAEQARALGGEHGFEGFEYYCTPRAEHPRSARFFDWSSIDRMATFDAFASVDLIGPRPLLIIVGTQAVTSWMASMRSSRPAGPRNCTGSRRQPRRPLRQGGVRRPRRRQADRVLHRQPRQDRLTASPDGTRPGGIPRRAGT